MAVEVVAVGGFFLMNYAIAILCVAYGEVSKEVPPPSSFMQNM